MSVYQVLVVDDSAFMRKIITDLIEQDPAFKVMETATTGKEAIEKAREHHPDLITMDVEMPVLNGLDALKVIVAEDEIPIIMLSGINEMGLRETIMSLEAGAFDFIRKPSINHGQDIEEVGNELRNQMKEAMLMKARRAERKLSEESLTEKVDLQTQEQHEVPSLNIQKLNHPHLYKSRPAKDTQTKESKPVFSPKPVTNKNNKSTKDNKNDEKVKNSTQKKTIVSSPEIPVSLKTHDVSQVFSRKNVTVTLEDTQSEKQKTNTMIQQLVAIGCSTGGPRALKSLLSQIPKNFPAPIVIVQHMPPDFTRSLANRIDSFSHIRVVEAEQGMHLEAGVAYIAPGGYHMRVIEVTNGKYELRLSQEEIVNGHRPSVDTLFESIIPYSKLQRHIVLLTGMGSDGARMMKRLYDTGVCSTFAENEESCVVYGMPRAAVELACVQQVLPLKELTSKLIQAVMNQT
ncbi:chemotaxis-specific protein-glutamate methyltransferase CheB [Paenibacillus gallinarum]|uniref:Protein-glutamate methylesterase/protein-glutamine glutaminase n=1 Tax=Paenibacillus gallinarum TaxID=2762232 RepID=A0ABR8SUT1_9BACL|nr:chemotaxis-specific protein-glutamate methyltransferase CheB [Paenibacillus gallinarum]MBD7967238.1 chemotaxis-specific protein-glutamate methyltransferase CheB [Paenibacillus gallinarum]